MDFGDILAVAAELAGYLPDGRAREALAVASAIKPAKLLGRLKLPSARPEPANNALDHHRLAAQAPVYLALARLCPVSLHDHFSIDKTRWPRLPLLAR